MYSTYTFNGKDWLDTLGVVAVARGWLKSAKTPGKALTLGRFPWWLLRLAAPLLPICRVLVDMRYLGQRPHALDNGKLLALLGSEPHRALVAAAAAAAAVADLFPSAGGIGKLADGRVAG